MMKYNKAQIIGLKRKRGEKNLSVGQLADELGLSRFTVSRIINHSSSEFTSSTVIKVNDWVLKEYVLS